MLEFVIDVDVSIVVVGCDEYDGNVAAVCFVGVVVVVIDVVVAVGVGNVDVILIFVIIRWSCGSVSVN